MATIDEILSQIEAKTGEEIFPKIKADLKKVEKLFTGLETEKERLLSAEIQA